MNSDCPAPPTSRSPGTPEPRALAYTPAVLALTYGTSNVGDDIQTLAMLQHAPLGAEIVWHDRDDLANYQGPPARLVANGWWAHGERAWPPPPEVDVLPISMHIQEKSRDRFERIGFEGLLGAGGVGARDTNTLAWLESIGVPAYFSACMTLTLPRSQQPRSDNVIAVDLRGRQATALRHALRGHADVMRITHTIPRNTPREERLRIARERLDLYAQASLVVTTRLHAALPCVAMGTPVLLLGRSIRFAGLDEFVPIANQVTDEALADALSAPDLTHREVAADLARAAKEFLRPCSI